MPNRPTLRTVQALIILSVAVATVIPLLPFLARPARAADDPWQPWSDTIKLVHRVNLEHLQVVAPFTSRCAGACLVWTTDSAHRKTCTLDNVGLVTGASAGAAKTACVAALNAACVPSCETQ